MRCMLDALPNEVCSAFFHVIGKKQCSLSFFKVEIRNYLRSCVVKDGFWGNIRCTILFEKSLV